MTWNEVIMRFYKSLKLPALPDEIAVLNPFNDPESRKAAAAFYKKYYADYHKRHMIIGINPGRFGAGVTGVPFTDPIRLTDVCGIKNSRQRMPELSSIFMYEMMEAYGGEDLFFQRFYITSVSPLGFVSNDKNLNYYDHKALAAAIMPFAEYCMERQVKWPVKRDVCFCIGEGKNLEYLEKMNHFYHWFEQIVSLPHPRYIMQYKRMQIDEYIHLYLETFEKYGLR